MSGWWGTASAKTQFLKQLARRAGSPWPDSDADPFMFDAAGDHWRNLAQLEAVVEFYANFDDPWRPGTVPRRPGDPGYVTVDLKDLEGTEATVAGNVVTLNGNPDLTRVKVNPNPNPRGFLYDTIELEGDTRRPRKRYRITAVNNAGHTVTIDPASPGGAVAAGGPLFEAAKPKSKWKIILRPVLVVIDAMGPRQVTLNPGLPNEQSVVLQGNNATQNAANRSRITLDGNPDLAKVNPNFDTVYFAADKAEAPAHRPWRTYRIAAIDNAAKTVTVDGTPDFDGNPSTWHIPSGLSGELPRFAYTLGPGGARGFDHFDGVAFVIHGGRVRNRFRWSSYTSRNNAARVLSSVRGNRPYDYFSWRSGVAFRNYSLAVTDPAAMPTYNGVREARFYFANPVGDDSIAAPGLPNGGGKTEIRFHFSTTNNPGGGCSSAGCIVSSDYYGLRDALITILEEEHDAFHAGSSDPEAAKALTRNLPGAPGAHHDRSELLWTNTENAAVPVARRLTFNNWTDKLFGRLWLIRPDERPLP